jgi:DNA helicase HerA-like ATPase
MIPDLTNKMVMFAGATGSGKSHLLGSAAEQLYIQGRSFIVLDTKQMNHAGLYYLKNVKILKIYAGKFYDWKKVLMFPYVVCIPDRLTRTKDLIETYRQLLQVAYEERIPKTYIIEEAHLYNPSPNYPDDTLELITRDGRGYNMNIFFATQRIQDFPKLLWSQCKYSYLFRALIPQDVRYISSFIPNFPEINYRLREHEVIKYYHETNQYLIIPPEKVGRLTPHYG